MALCVIFAVAFGVDAAVYFKEQFLDGGKCDFHHVCHHLLCVYYVRSKISGYDLNIFYMYMSF